MAQRDRARYRPRRQALRDNRRLLRRAPAPPPWRSRQNLNPPETVPINWQITWQTSLPVSSARDRIIPSPSAPARRGQRLAYDAAEQAALRALSKSEQRGEADRARAILLTLEGRKAEEIAAVLGVHISRFCQGSRQQVSPELG
jgi:DNA-directed RNA polymerase specialized sigma24 family protein